MPTPAVLTTIRQVREWRAAQRNSNQSVGFVPTMGGLHEGHAALIRESAGSFPQTIVSVFVNPLQFGAGEDFAKYPRTIDADLELCGHAGANAVFLANQSDMYPAGFETHVHPGPMADVLCGRSRPGHFRGVLTVVAKLFGIVEPTVAFFGRKDFQQVAIVRRMVADLNLPVEIRACDTVREPDGLAMSTRNKYLNPEQRKNAICLFRAMGEIRAAFRSGERDGPKLRSIGVKAIESVPEARIDYVEIVDADSLQTVTVATGSSVICLAVYLGTTRLIDNGVIAG